MRQAMEAHRANPVCASCHARMDPIGFAMENFDAVGQWRDERRRASRSMPRASFPTATKFNGVAELKKALLRHPEQFVETVAEKLLMYGIGRNVQYYDQPAVRAIVRQAAASNYSFAVARLRRSEERAVPDAEVAGGGAQGPFHYDGGQALISKRRL